MKKGIIIGLLLCLGYVNFNFNVIADKAALERHVAGFEELLQSAESDSFYKYGIYSSRILAVKHPEVYLRGDMIFAGYITSHPGYAKAYHEKPVSVFLNNFRKLKKGDDKPFTFDLVDFSKYEIVPKETIYGPQMPVFGFLDERLAPVQTTLKVKQITSLEGANLIYVKQRVEGNPGNHLFIIVTKDKTGFVADAGKFYDCRGSEVKKENIKDPILIFNEKVVWYPLMDRDDTGQDADLSKLVQEIAAADNLPELDDTEKQLLAGLKSASSLTAEQMNYAWAASINFGGNGDGKEDIGLQSTGRNNLGSLTCKFITYLGMKKGNYLSPYTAYLATIISSNNFDNLKRFEAFYLRHIGTDKNWLKGRLRYSAWGHTWSCGLIENNIEDAFRTRGGHCVSQATNISAALELAGVEHIHFTYLAANAEKSHTILFLTGYKMTFDNGHLLRSEFYKKKYNPLPEIKEIMVDHHLEMFTRDLIYSNVSKDEAYALHRKADQLGKEIFGTGTMIPFKENAGFIYRMKYKALTLP